MESAGPDLVWAPDDAVDSDAMDEDGEEKGLLGTGDNKADVFGSLAPGLRRQTSATIVRQSQPYVLFNILVLVVLTALVIWVVVTPGHYPMSPIFIALEVLVTTTVTVEVCLEVAHYGCWTYFFPDFPRDGASTAVRCSRVLLHIWNWFQFFLVLLCVASLLLFLRGTQEEAAHRDREQVEFDSVLVLAGLVGRYMFYLTFVCCLQWRVTQAQGGWGFSECRTAVRGCIFCNCYMAPPLKEQWDIFIEDGGHRHLPPAKAV